MVVCLGLMHAGTSVAHEIRPSIMHLQVLPDGQLTVQITTNLEALVSEIGADHEDTRDSPQADAYDALRKLPPDELTTKFSDFSARLLQGVSVTSGTRKIPLVVDRVEVAQVGDTELPRTSDIWLQGAVQPGDTTLRFSWSADFGDSVLRVKDNSDAVSFTQFLQNGTSSDAVAIEHPIAQSLVDQFSEYLWVGFTHIIPKGLDHILFVVGLFLLSLKLAPLLWQITVFTIAHSITLALAMVGVVSVPASIVEPAIAASIVYICIENLLTDSLNRWRLLVVFVFGLLHGLGFASVLTEIGLGAGEFVLGLVAFNVGVELGQIMVVLICLATFGWFSQMPWYRRWLTRPASVIVGLIGVMWFVERVFLA